jgi:hypothetical protein
MWKMFRCFAKRFTPDPYLEDLLKRNREALERKRREARLPAHTKKPVTEELQRAPDRADPGALTGSHIAGRATSSRK